MQRREFITLREDTKRGDRVVVVIARPRCQYAPSGMQSRGACGGTRRLLLDDGNRAMNYRSLSAIGVIADKRRFLACDSLSAYDPSETLAVHCGNGFDTGFSPYQSTRLNRYDAVS